MGVFSEKVFKKWQNGGGSLNLPEFQSYAGPIMQVDGGVVIAIRTPVASGDEPSREASIHVRAVENQRSSQRAQTFVQLATRTSLNVDFDRVRNRIIFSTGPTEIHDATLDFHDCGAKFYVAAVFLSGENICKVQIASAPMLTFRDSHIEKREADEFMEKFQTCLMADTKKTLQQLLTDGASQKHEQELKAEPENRYLSVPVSPGFWFIV